MLYVDLNNQKQTYTAYQALVDFSLNVVPLRFPCFSASELAELANGSFSQISAKILNLFFNTALTAEDIEACLKKNPLIPDNLDRKTLLIELQGDSGDGISSLINDIYGTLAGGSVCAYAWPYLAIKISLLFGLYGDLKRCGIHGFDAAVYPNELLGLLPVLYARKMGLPINMIICGCLDEESIWKLLHTGELRSSGAAGIDAFLYAYSPEETVRYGHVCASNDIFCLSDEQLKLFNADIYTAVVSADRAKDLINNIGKTYEKTISSAAAVSYGALQDYRAVSGENRVTLIFTEESIKS